ncbi:Lipoprotein OS=Tsukamurella paurometabola (strain ATCC 8368 / DSM / CCUG 35730 / CIP 100753/ JCM 10117 / KCTC 9821 / NBRC 16120 / NCIMB 702349 / NCTC 13040)OX=521096 GN=Tpau_3704 PE=4 SV=1 [Tsukamurella paurometabola]|uniref:Lipoprotein n=2 Tax=Tsukamurella paurometabola TaxID=2061 RepID=D5UY45_TSUPD|nr:hypothetical protein Tpau_3704 [Tsukamurella paurometabola DSM 20162]SUP39131.1 Uncharacterised protein [Tsukamurella paurometabola]
MRFCSTAIAVSALVLVGCSTTVRGTPVADEAAVAAQLDVGSYPKKPRTIATPNDSTARALEASRLADTVPLLREIDPALRYGGGGYLGDRGALKLSLSVSSSLSDAVGDFELGATFSANDHKPGTTGNRTRELTVAVVRMASREAAAKAVASPEFLKPGRYPDTEERPVSLPDRPSAVAFSTEWKTLKNWSVEAIMQVGEYVVGGFAAAPTVAESAKYLSDFLGRQQKNLETFASTPLDRLGTLKADPEGIVRLTLPSTAAGVWATSVSALGRSTDIEFAQRAFTETGVDLVGYGGNSVYRTRDAAAARVLADKEDEWNRSTYPAGSVPTTITVAPGARCWTHPEFEGSKDTTTQCAVARGRYVAFITDGQTTKALQAANASYLVLGEAD